MWWWRGAGTKAQESPNPGLASSRWARVQTLALRVGARYSQGQTRYREERQGVSASFQTKEMLQRPRGGKEMTEAAQMGNGVASLPSGRKLKSVGPRVSPPIGWLALQLLGW